MFKMFSCLKMSVGIVARRSQIRNRTTASKNRNRHLTTTGIFEIGETWPKRRDSKTHRWNRAVANADKFLRFPDILALKNTLNGFDILELASQMRKIAGSSHPLLEKVKCLVYENNGHQNLHVRGLIVLLWANGLSKPDSERDMAIVQKERNLATMAELLHGCLMIHSGIVDVENVFSEEDMEVKEVRYANKLAVIIGDLMLGKAFTLLDQMGNAAITCDCKQIIVDYTDGKFMLESDIHGQAVPTETTNFTTWENRSFKKKASLLAKSLKSVHILNGLEEKSAKNGYDFGKNFCLAWKVSEELKEYSDQHRHSEEPFSLVSLPVILQILRDPGLLELVTPHREDLSRADYKKIREVVCNGQSVEDARNIFSEYILEAQKNIQELPHSETQEVLRNLLFALEV